MTVTRYGYTDSPLGRLLVVGEQDALTGLHVDGHEHAPTVHPDWERDDGDLDEVRAQLEAYFAGQRTDFDLAVRPAGSAFQREVWAALSEIPFGETRTYGQIATRISRPDAVRAIGAANGANPISIVIPCHRVIGADGSLTGYGWGVERKSWLLDHERGHAPTGTPRLFEAIS